LPKTNQFCPPKNLLDDATASPAPKALVTLLVQVEEIDLTIILSDYNIKLSLFFEAGQQLRPYS